MRGRNKPHDSTRGKRTYTTLYMYSVGVTSSYTFGWAVLFFGIRFYFILPAKDGPIKERTSTADRRRTCVFQPLTTALPYGRPNRYVSRYIANDGIIFAHVSVLMGENTNVSEENLGRQRNVLEEKWIENN